MLWLEKTCGSRVQFVHTCWAHEGIKRGEKCIHLRRRVQTVESRFACQRLRSRIPPVTLKPERSGFDSTTLLIILRPASLSARPGHSLTVWIRPLLRCENTNIGAWIPSPTCSIFAVLLSKLHLESVLQTFLRIRMKPIYFVQFPVVVVAFYFTDFCEHFCHRGLRLYWFLTRTLRLVVSFPKRLTILSPKKSNLSKMQWLSQQIILNLSCVLFILSNSVCFFLNLHF